MQTKKIQTTSFALHMLAMALMLCDHLWHTVVQGNDWMNCIGRMAFPIFAFMVAEGYVHTRNIKRYVLRMLVFAVLSELPFNLMVSGSVFYPGHQNVLWTFLLALGLIRWTDWAKHSGKTGMQVLAWVGVALGALAAELLRVDYGLGGVLTVLVFCFFRGDSWQRRLIQLVCLGYINLAVLGGIGCEVTVLGRSFLLARQGFALLALIPIWMYKGRQGPHSKLLQYLYYSFYPLHLLVLGLCRG